MPETYLLCFFISKSQPRGCYLLGKPAARGGDVDVSDINMTSFACRDRDMRGLYS